MLDGRLQRLTQGSPDAGEETEAAVEERDDMSPELAGTEGAAQLAPAAGGEFTSNQRSSIQVVGYFLQVLWFDEVLGIHYI